MGINLISLLLILIIAIICYHAGLTANPETEFMQALSRTLTNYEWCVIAFGAVNIATGILVCVLVMWVIKIRR